MDFDIFEKVEEKVLILFVLELSNYGHQNYTIVDDYSIIEHYPIDIN